MIDSDFRAALHYQLGPALDELVAPDLLDRVRARQVRHKRSVRAGLALCASATVAAAVVAVAVWPSTTSAGPTAPASSLASPALPSSVTPSAAIVNIAAVDPLVLNGPCAGLTVAAYRRADGAHPPVTGVTSVGAVITMGGDQALELQAGGPCVDRLSYVQRTSAFWNDPDVPHAFVNGLGAVVTHASATNQTGAVQLFLDCKGLVCAGSGASLATITVRVTRTAPAAASLPFAPLPSSLAPPTGQVLTVPSLIGLSLEAARQVLAAAGFSGYGVGYAGGTGPAGLVVAQDPAAGSVVPKTGGVTMTLSGRPPAGAPTPVVPHGVVVPPTSVVPSALSSTVGAMPSVIGLSLSKAAAVLKAAGINYEVVHAIRPQAVGTVTFQKPKAGQPVSPHDTVQLTVSMGPLPRQ